jgi:excisionase family DNA binding protein
MNNPFDEITARLTQIEALLIDLKKGTPERPAENDQYIGIKEAAALINLSPATVYNLVMRRQIPYLKNRQKLYFSARDLRAWIEAGRQRTADDIQAGAFEHIAR